MVGVRRVVRGGRAVAAVAVASSVTAVTAVVVTAVAGGLPHEGERLLDVEVLGVRVGPRAGGGHQASGRVSGVASGATSGLPRAGADPVSAASSAQRWARAAALRAVSATASGPPPARPAA